VGIFYYYERGNPVSTPRQVRGHNHLLGAAPPGARPSLGRVHSCARHLLLATQPPWPPRMHPQPRLCLSRTSRSCMELLLETLACPTGVPHLQENTTSGPRPRSSPRRNTARGPALPGTRPPPRTAQPTGTACREHATSDVLQGLLERKDTHRPKGGHMLLGIGLL
jgi:hypothetical protein